MSLGSFFIYTKKSDIIALQSEAFFQCQAELFSAGISKQPKKDKATQNVASKVQIYDVHMVPLKTRQRKERRMCLICIEQIGLNHLDNDEAVEEFSRFEQQILSDVYLQEHPDTERVLEAVGGSDAIRPEDIMMVLLCRIVDNIINQNDTNAKFGLVEKYCPEELVQLYLAKLDTANSRIASLLNDKQFYLLESLPENIIEDQSAICSEADKILNGFLRDIQRETAGETAIVPNETGSSVTDSRYLVTVWVSLLFLIKYRPDSPIIGMIGLEYPPHNMNLFWIKRRALVASVQHYGVRFIIDNFDRLEFSPLCTIISRRIIDDKEIVLLKDYLSKKDPSIRGETDGLMGAIIETYPTERLDAGD